MNRVRYQPLKSPFYKPSSVTPHPTTGVPKPKLRPPQLLAGVPKRSLGPRSLWLGVDDHLSGTLVAQSRWRPTRRNPADAGAAGTAPETGIPSYLAFLHVEITAFHPKKQYIVIRISYIVRMPFLRIFLSTTRSVTKYYIRYAICGFWTRLCGSPAALGGESPPLKLRRIRRVFWRAPAFVTEKSVRH